MDVIHKRMMDCRLLGNRTWTKCHPEIYFTGREYSHQNPNFVEWAKMNKHHWKDVRCETCLRLRFEK